MTKEEAIEYNKNLRLYMQITDKESEYKFLEENYVALDMAIDTLEQQSCEEYNITHNENGYHIHGKSYHFNGDLIQPLYYSCSSYADCIKWIYDHIFEQEPCEDAVRGRRMTNEEAIQEIKYVKDKTGYADKALDMAIKALEQEPPWIPVSERLPEKNMLCLVSVGKLYLTQTAIYSDLMGTIDQGIFYQGDYGHETFVNITQYVNAWMPLPEPYKAERSGKE